MKETDSNIEHRLFNANSLVLCTDSGSRVTARKLINVYPGVILNNVELYDVLSVNKKNEAEIKTMPVDELHHARTFSHGIYIQIADNNGSIFYIGKNDELAYSSPEILAPFESHEKAQDHWKILNTQHKLWLRYTPIFIDAAEALRRHVIGRKLNSLIALNNAINSTLKKQIETMPLLSSPKKFNDLLTLSGDLEFTIETIKLSVMKVFL